VSHQDRKDKTSIKEKHLATITYEIPIKAERPMTSHSFAPCHSNQPSAAGDEAWSPDISEIAADLGQC